MTTLWATIVVLGVLIFVHELGHYLAARSIGVRVNRFSIGYPPRILTFTSIPDGWEIRLFFFRRNRDEKLKWSPIKTVFISKPGRSGSLTEYCLSIIPFGGYVKVAGVIDESLDTNIEYKPDELMSKPRWAQIWFMSAGVIMNVLLAYILFTGVAIYMGKPVISDEPIISELVPDMPAESAGLLPGDRILEINDQTVSSWEDLTKIIHAIPERRITLTYLRGNHKDNLDLVTQLNVNSSTGDTVGVIGIYPQFDYQPITFAEGLKTGAVSTLRGFGLLILSIQMITSGKASIKDLGGPILIAQLAGESARAGWIPLFTLMALISCNLAFLNVLPIPGLDGGHILITLIEGTIRRPLTTRTRLVIQQIGMTLLLLLMVTVIINDIGRLFTN